LFGFQSWIVRKRLKDDFDKVNVLKNIKAIPSALVAVLIGVLINEIFRFTGSSFLVGTDHLVSLPVPKSLSAFFSQFSLPDFAQITNKEVWVVALTITAVASIETLLCVEAADKIDPLKWYTNTNRELKAQGIGNMLSCLIPVLLNKIPLASLAAVLIAIGFKLASPKVFIHMWKNSKKFQFIPFVVTVIAIIFTDLLVGVGIVLTVSIYFILRGNSKLAYFFKKDDSIAGKNIYMELTQ
jgi:MFS superfamily sulfate permease-like transporter